MKTLYVTDLDGTLLNSHSQVSAYTVESLNKLIEEGIYFTVATARTPATVVPILEKVNINIPIIVMNGSFIYDIKENKYIYTSQIPYESVDKIVDIVEERGKQVCIYTLKNDFLTVYHKGFNSKEEEKFCSDRSDLKLKKFIDVEHYNITKEHKVGHMVMIDSYEVIKDIMSELEKVSGIHPVMYKDINTQNSYILEIAVANSHKAKGIEILINNMDVNEIVAFGDNLNDREMIKMADCGCVVGNAQETIKAYADCVIGTNNEDGVVRFIEANCKSQTA